MEEYRIDFDRVLDKLGPNEAVVMASGDLRLPANQTCWPMQEGMERALAKVFAAEGFRLIRGHAYDPVEKHGFISTQRMGIDIFNRIPPEAPVIVAVAAWQYSYHVLAGLKDHRGPILTIGNWDGAYPGLVGLLNLNACLTKMEVAYSTIWSRDFTDNFFLNGIRQWIKEGKVTHATDHVEDLDLARLPKQQLELGRRLARELRSKKAVLGVFDEGCMGMFNAIVEDGLLNDLGLYKERLSQSALLAAMERVSDDEALGAFRWLQGKGMRFEFGSREDTELTERQVLGQMKMYIGAVRMAHFFGCSAIGIQYQQGLKDMAPASDLAEGLMNNVDRPPVFDAASGKELFARKPLVHFNEVDECAGIDSLVTNIVWEAMSLDPAVTLHDVRYGEQWRREGDDDFVWVFMISGAVPASHLEGGYRGAVSKRQPPMFFPKGGGTLSGVCRPGEIVWSRIFIADGRLQADIGRGSSVELQKEETQRRLQMTNPEWPIMHAVLHGVSRDQFMARHKSNHLNVAYAPSPKAADQALAAKAAMFSVLGIEVHLCGRVPLG